MQRSVSARGMRALTAVAGAMVLLLAGCAGPPRPRHAVEDSRAFVDVFMRNVVAADHEAAFRAIDIDVLVNLGRPQREFYRSLPAQGQERYRRDFVAGIYAFLFREMPAAQALFEVAVPARDNLTVSVTGRPGTRLLLTLRRTPEGYRITGLEKAQREGK